MLRCRPAESLSWVAEKEATPPSWRDDRGVIVSDRVSSPLVTRLGLPFVPVDVRERFPFEDDDFDLVFCASVIEHIESPNRMLVECRRILKPGGALYLSFPPFYSLFLVGGHQFNPFHLLGERVALGIYNWRHGISLRSYAEESEGLQLFPLTINSVHRRIARHFEIKNVFTRLVGLNTARWPGFLKDLATWHVCYLATKPMIADVDQ